jgi:hypothetical protein
MVSHLFYYQLALLALLWLFVMLPLSWPRRSATPASRASHAHQAGSVTNSCALTPWWKGAYSSRAIAKKALVGIHRTDLIDIQ